MKIILEKTDDITNASVVMDVLRKANNNKHYNRYLDDFIKTLTNAFDKFVMERQNEDSN